MVTISKPKLLATIIILLVGSASFYLGQVLAIPAPSIGSTVEPGSLSISCSFTIYIDGSIILAKNGKTGANDYSGTDAVSVATSAIGGLTGGRTWQESVCFKGSFTWNSRLDIPAYTYLDLTYGLFTLANSVNAIMFQFTGSHSTVHGGTINANHQNQASNRQVIQTNGCGLSDIEVSNTYIYNDDGFAIFTFGGPTSRCQNVRVIGNTIVQIAGAVHDIIVVIANGGQVANNIVTVTQGTGLNLYESDNVIAYGNYFNVIGVGGTGVCYCSSLYSQLIGTTVNSTSTGTIAIKIATETDNANARIQKGGTISDSYLINNQQSGVGIRVNNATSFTIHDNIIRNFATGFQFASQTIDSFSLRDNVFLTDVTNVLASVTPTNTQFRSNQGYNPTGSIANPLSATSCTSITTCTIGLYGTATLVSASKDYIVSGVDVYITSTGGTSVAIVIKDNLGNIIWSPGATLSGYFLPIGYRINWGACSPCPSPTAFGN